MTSNHLPTSFETHPFLVRNHEGTIFQCERLWVRWREVTRTKKIVADLFREVEHDHWDHSKLRVATAHPRTDTNDRKVVAPNGSSSRGGEGNTVDHSTKGLKQVARRITEADAEEIAIVDMEIVELQERIAQLRTKRKQLVTVAWRRGKEILVHLVTPESDDKPVRYYPEH